MKKELRFDNPKRCPCGHKHLSWSEGEEEVYCWDCDRKYPISQCFGPQNMMPSTDKKEESIE